MLNREMPAVPDMSCPKIDVRDVALAHRLATEKPDAAGKRFILQEHATGFQEWSIELASEFKSLGTTPQRGTCHISSCGYMPDLTKRCEEFFLR
mmetsp:Transcript_6854/g.12144  ORF Transcript_6854/g.12144 Transcript_6854/m.12144 type:complete len:94 (-) Transcript_6854:711-992(-)